MSVDRTGLIRKPVLIIFFAFMSVGIVSYYTGNSNLAFHHALVNVLYVAN